MNDKPVTNCPFYTKDSKGNVVYYKRSDGIEAWYEYDENNNRIHFKDSDGFEAWYDSEGNEIPNPNLVTEITLDDIAKKFKVDVKNLKETNMNHIYPTHEEATEYVKQQGWSYENEFNEKEFERLTKLHYTDNIPIDDMKKLGMIWNAYFNYRMTKKS